MAVYPLAAFPKDVALRDGHQARIRPLEPDDEQALLGFYLAIPPADRFVFKHDVTAPGVVASFCRERDFDRALPLVALDGGRIVAEAVLLRPRGFYRRGTGEIRVVVAPEYRGKGLGTALTKELCDIGNENELDRLVLELVGGVQEDAITVAEELGFVHAATLSDHVRDEEGKPRDLVIYVLPLGKWYEWLGVVAEPAGAGAGAAPYAP